MQYVNVGNTNWVARALNAGTHQVWWLVRSLAATLSLSLAACITVYVPEPADPAAAQSETASEAARQLAGGAADEPAPEPSARERKIIKYIESMTYMVYFNEQAEEDPFLMKAAVSSANRYLAESGLEAVNLAQIEDLKKDKIRVYEEESGESITLIQWIAQKLHADIYLEIDGRTTSESARDKYYAEASVTLTVFEASTARLLGSALWNSPKQLNTTSESNARLQALQVSVRKAMPKAIEQAQAYMEKALEKGIRYQLIVQNTPDTKLMNTFRRRLENEVEEIEIVSQSSETTSYYVFLIGSVAELVDIVYDTAEAMPELEALEQVLLRGRSVTFDTGL